MASKPYERMLVSLHDLEFEVLDSYKEPGVLVD
jgi:hypothetical protein